MKRIIDEIHIVVQAGNGGKGCASRIRITEKKYIPTGGEGGRGGNVIMRADANVQSLKEFLYHRHFEAESGTQGGNSHKKGKRGQDLMILVPCGTMVLEREKHFLIRDLVRNGDEVVLLQGGRGGMGNAGGKKAKPGEKGGSLDLTLSLKLPAEVFLVGLPNSGKSRLMNRLTRAHPKVESYPFSTKVPELGTYQSPEFRQIRICELPALYRESPEGRGAGVDFLKHLFRAKIVLLVLDPLNDFASSLEEGYGILREVLGRYDKSFLEIPEAIVVNKMDLAEVRERVEKEKFRPAAPLFLISAETGEGIEPLMRYVAQKIEEPANV